MKTRQEVEDAWRRALEEGPPIGICDGYGEDPNPPADIDKLANADRFLLDDSLTPEDVAKLPKPKEDYSNAEDF